MSNTWQLQEAKNQLSLVVEKAMTKGVQTITKHGEPAVVVISFADDQKIRPRQKKLVDLLRSWPVRTLTYRG